MKKDFICINCPIGCRLETEIKHGLVVNIKGNMCKRGDTYAKQEAVQPVRILTANMKSRDSDRPFSVITDKEISKDMMIKCALELKKHKPSLPIRAGDVIIENILDTKSNIIATSSLVKRSLY